MSHARFFAFVTLASLTGISLAACSGGVVNVGANDQQLKKKTDGGATGDGQTCSFDDVVWYDANTGESGTIPSATGQYSVGQTFKSPDGCNDCTCTTSGITCTAQACSSPADGGRACTEEAKQCPDGSYVSRTGPNCEFAPCPGGDGGVCTVDGVSYKAGETFPAPDGCNSCGCGADGLVSCTAMACVGCPAPRQPPPETVCTQNVVYAKNPMDGTCCMYGTPCNAPSSWKTYPNQTDCQNAN